MRKNVTRGFFENLQMIPVYKSKLRITGLAILGKANDKTLKYIDSYFNLLLFL